MPIIVESVFSEQIVITICLVITLAVDIFERVSIWFSFLCFKPQKIHLEIGFAILCYFSVIFQFVWTIVFLTFWSMHVTCICNVTPLPAVLVLRNAKVYIGSSNCSNIAFYIEACVDKAFCFHTILRIPNVDPYHSHVRFGWCLDNMRLRS